MYTLYLRTIQKTHPMRLLLLSLLVSRAHVIFLMSVAKKFLAGTCAKFNLALDLPFFMWPLQSYFRILLGTDLHFPRQTSVPPLSSKPDNSTSGVPHQLMGRFVRGYWFFHRVVSNESIPVTRNFNVNSKLITVYKSNLTEYFAFSVRNRRLLAQLLEICSWPYSRLRTRAGFQCIGCKGRFRLPTDCPRPSMISVQL